MSRLCQKYTHLKRHIARFEEKTVRLRKFTFGRFCEKLFGGFLSKMRLPAGVIRKKCAINLKKQKNISKKFYLIFFHRDSYKK